MKELTQISQVVIDALKQAGIPAMAAYPAERARQYDSAVAAVRCGNRRGQGLWGFVIIWARPGTRRPGRCRKLYGKQLEAVISVEIRAPGAALCEEGLRSGNGGIAGWPARRNPPGELSWEAISWEKSTGMFLRRGGLRCRGGLYGEEP